MKGLCIKLCQVSIAVCFAFGFQGLVATPYSWAAVSEESAAGAAPVTPEESPAVEEMTAPQAVAPPTPSRRDTGPSEASLQVQKELLQPQFAYNPRLLLDPFKPFIAPAETPAPVALITEDDIDPAPPEAQRPLTPLQRMRISEVEAGLKAIMWGPLGRRAVIEDASGKGYIVSVGTPVGERNGVVIEIFNDHLVIQQENWDRKEKRMIPENVMVKLKKATQ